MRKSFQQMKHLRKKLHVSLHIQSLFRFFYQLQDLGLVVELYSPGFGVPGTMADHFISCYFSMGILLQGLRVMKRLSCLF